MIENKSEASRNLEKALQDMSLTSCNRRSVKNELIFQAYNLLG